ncbi:MAG: hypothetical protein IVW53_12490 [Chloroflexi bacterium]|nr:hypothetical protein [Chloroflexota bacterium]
MSTIPSDRSSRPHRPRSGPAPDAIPAAVGGGLGPGDPLVRALVSCIRQAHARRLAGTALD